MNDNDSEMLGLLAELSAAAAPSDLAGEVVHAATAARPVGQPITALGGGVAADPRAAFVETAGELAVVLADATSAMIVEPYGWNATQLVAHLLEVDLYFGRQLGLWDHAIDESMEHDHLRMTEAAVRASMRADLADTIAKWTDVSCAVCEHVLALDADALATRIKFHMLDTRTSTALVVRIFEMWTHTEDLCRTLRRQPPVLDAGRLALMTRAAVRAIPLGLLLGRIEAGPQTVRIVLTGAGGGVWNQPLTLGVEAGESSVTIVADALAFCRLAAQRIAPEDLDADVEGPTALALDVLRGASVFAA